MDNEILEEVVTPEVEEQAPAEASKDIAATAMDILDKSKATAVTLIEKAKTLPKKIWMIAGVAVVAVIALIVVLSMLGNTYKTPVQAAEKLLNANSVEKIIDGAPDLLNGFGESELKQAIKILKKSDQYKDMIEDAEEAYSEYVDNMKDTYGKNFKIKIEVEDKEKLEKEDLKSFRNNLRDVAEMAEELDDLDSDDYEDIADAIGISKSKAKDLVKLAKAFAKECKSAEVKAGYELSLVISMTGSELEEPEETEMTVRVFKVDGRWVPDVFSLIQDMGMGMGMIGRLIGSLY